MGRSECLLRVVPSDRRGQTTPIANTIGNTNRIPIPSGDFTFSPLRKPFSGNRIIGSIHASSGNTIGSSSNTTGHTGRASCPQMSVTLAHSTRPPHCTDPTSLNGDCPAVSRRCPQQSRGRGNDDPTGLARQSYVGVHNSLVDEGTMTPRGWPNSCVSGTYVTETDEPGQERNPLPNRWQTTHRRDGHQP